jgi:hypothetical protein
MSTPTMVRNTAAGPTVFSDGTNNIEWAPAGDPAGGDIQPVPASVLENVQFHRTMARRILVVEEADDVVASALAAHRQDWETRLAAQRTASTASIDQAPQNDSVIKTCIGPSGRSPDQLCGADVPIKQAKVNEIPPLCAMHSGLSGQYIATETERIVEGKPEVVWVKARIAAPTRQDD